MGTHLFYTTTYELTKSFGSISDLVAAVAKTAVGAQVLHFMPSTSNRGIVVVTTLDEHQVADLVDEYEDQFASLPSETLSVKGVRALRRLLRHI